MFMPVVLTGSARPLPVRTTGARPFERVIVSNSQLPGGADRVARVDRVRTHLSGTPEGSRWLFRGGP
jgi:hypothetical protein